VSVEYRLLGPLEVVVDGRPVTLAGPRQRAVLVCLLAQSNTVVPATRLIDELWGDDPPVTAANVLQSYVSQLRKALGKGAIETRGGGYAARVDSQALDLLRFERSAHQGSQALADDRAREAAEALREALALWRGPPLADLADEPAVTPIARRLEELHVLALERRIEADLACGHHAEIVAEAGELVRAHPLRERPRWLHMLALYRSGRQAEALDSYRTARTMLVEELGIEPGAALQELERAILRQDPSLEVPTDGSTRPSEEPPARSIVVTTLTEDTPTGLIELAAPLAIRPPRELLVLQTVSDASDLPHVSTALRALRAELIERGLETRSAAFTSLMPGADLARVATDQDADLLLVDAPDQLLEDGRLLALLAQAPCDVGIVVGPLAGAGDVFVPFAGGEHDWAAVELGAWLARSQDSQLWLAGATTGVAGRDASRLLASASLAVQRVLGVAAEPVLVEPEPSAVVAAAAGAAVVCAGLPDRWQREGLGPTRTALAARAEGPTLLVRRGVRPGGLAPQGADTRYTWTIAG
jgi:DNA-binding SARP family transcriptional activator